MPRVFEFNGRTIVLEDGDVRAALNSLVRQSEVQLWGRAGGPNSLFTHYLNVYDEHARFHSVNLFVQVMEVLGGADLPPASFANRLRRQQTTLSRQLNPRGIGRFYQDFSRFNRDQARFVNMMKRYQSGMISGATTTVQVLEVTRDSSFLVLGTCANILTAGAASGPVAAAASASGGALLRGAASSFILNEIRNGATRVGRVLAGERVTAAETGQEILNSALNAIPDAILGQLVGKFLKPLTNSLTNTVTREIARGNLFGVLQADLTKGQIEAAVGRAIDYIIGRRPIDVRRMLLNGRNERNPRGQANAMSNDLMRNRNFQGLLRSFLGQAAERAR